MIMILTIKDTMLMHKIIFFLGGGGEVIIIVGIKM